MKAQITLDNTYNVGNKFTSISYIDLAISGHKYVIFENANSKIKLYNIDHSIWKTIDIPVLPSFELNTVYINTISENLFNSDSKVEYIALYINTSVTPMQKNTRVYDETGAIVEEFPDRIFNGIFSTDSTTFKMFLSDGDLIREVYNLPGSSSNVNIQHENETSFIRHSYPNPSSNFITIPYNLEHANVTGILNIYNSNGQVIESFNIDNYFDSILVDLSKYSPGTYFYSVSQKGIESSSNSFIKQ